MSEYVPYEISVEATPSWMDRPIKVVFATATPNGSTSQAVYLDEAERDALILALGGVLAEQGEPEWEYARSEVLDDGTTAFGAPVATLAEAIHRRDIDRVNYPWPEELGVGRRRKPGPWLPVEENGENDG